MYKILIVGALSQELNVVKEQIKKLGLRNIKTSFLSTGIGNYNMILNLTRFLEKNEDFDFVVNIGICGMSNRLNSLVKPHPNPLLKGEGKQISRIFNLSNNKELIIPHIIDFGILSSIACSESVVYDENELKGENFVDMESYGFEKVCDSFSLARIILKVPVDRVGEETKNFDFKKAKKMLENFDYQELFEKIYAYLENTFDFQRKVKEKQDFDKYKNHFGFTFSENEIFKRLYYRYRALVNDDFLSYFEKNKDLGKKEFMKNFEEYLEGFLVK